MSDINNIINKFLAGNFIINEIAKDNDMFNYYANIKKQNNNYLTYLEIVKKLKKSYRTRLSSKKVKEIDFNLFTKISEVHGLNHMLRCSLYALIISISQNISDDDLDIVLTSIFYHDIGRVNDKDDDYHGYNAISKLEFLKSKDTEKNSI